MYYLDTTQIVVDGDTVAIFNVATTMYLLQRV